MSGTYADKQAPRGVMAAFLAIALVVVLVPFVGMAWARTDATTENRDLAAAPSLLDEGGAPNLGFLADAGEYFNDHFAYRNQAVALNARIRAMLGSSATDQVVVGSDGWLYYAGTLNDYLGLSSVSDRTLACIAHNLKLAQGYAESKGAAFAFTVAPNKNTLYDEHMPGFYVRHAGASNAERLVPYLEEAGVAYVDLFGALGGADEALYLKRDTHWDNRGALLAARELLASVGREGALAVAAQPEVRDDFVGDLQNMLYPGEGDAEPNYYYAGYHEADGATPALWSYAEGADVADSLVRTSGAGDGVAYVFRDSFGNALLPFLASSFEQATFSKLVPYNIPAVAQSQAQTVIIERAERHLSDLAVNPPIVPNPTLAFANGSPVGAREVRATVDVAKEGSYWVVTGSVDEPLSAGDRLYLAAHVDGAGDVYYDPFWMCFADESGVVTADNGFKAYIADSALSADAAAFRVLAS